MTPSPTGKLSVPCPILGDVPWAGIWLGHAGGVLGLRLTRIPVWEMEGGRVTP